MIGFNELIPDLSANNQKPASGIKNMIGKKNKYIPN